MDQLFDQVSLEGAWHVREIGTGRMLGGYHDVPVAIASVGKVPLTLALYRLADRGTVDLRRIVKLEPDGCSTGATGISAMRDRVSLSLRDAAYLALTISDNAAADALWDATTTRAIAAELDALDLGAIRLSQPRAISTTRRSPRAVLPRRTRSGAPTGPAWTSATPTMRPQKR